MDLGTWADWAAALAGFLAFGAVIWQQLVETKHRKAEERRSQAVQVSAWVEGVGSISKIPELDEEIRDGSYDKNNDLVRIRNASGSPIYDVIASLVGFTGPGYVSSEQAEMDDEDWGRFTLPQGRWVAIPPGMYQTVLPIREPWDYITTEPVVEIAFTDSGGAHWIRYGDGVLKELNQKPTVYFSDRPKSQPDYPLNRVEDS